METQQFTKRIIDFQKAFFENSYNTFTVMQNHSENMTNGFLKQFPWVNKDNTKPLDDSFSFIKKARDEYKKNIDQGFVKLEEMFCAREEKAVQKDTETEGSKKVTETEGTSQPVPVAPKVKQIARG